MALQPQKEKINFISILSSNATLRKVVPEGTLGAVEREYEDSKGEKHTKLEKVYESVSGKITDIKFVDTDYGTLLQVTLTDADEFLKAEPEVLSMSVAQPFAQDFMKKLPNIDLDKEVVLKPFAFTPDGKDRELKGLTVTQNGNKIEKSFVEKQGDKYVNIMGYPNPDEKLSSEKNEMKRKVGWQRYFVDVQLFLVEYTKENFANKFNKELVEEKLDEEIEVPKDF